MTDKQTLDTARILSGDVQDTRHVPVRVFPALKAEGGGAVASHRVQIGDGRVDLDYPTRLIFTILDEGWAFARFDLGGQSHDGLAVYPDGVMQASFGDAERRTVILDNPGTPGRFTAQALLAPTGGAAARSSSDDEGGSEKTGSIIILNGDREQI